jgi:hypothetical protein
LDQLTLEDQLGLLRRWRLWRLWIRWRPFVRFDRFDRWRRWRLLTLLRLLIQWHRLCQFVLCGLWHLCLLCLRWNPYFLSTLYFQYYP